MPYALAFLCYLGAFLCFGAAALGVVVARFNLVGVGLAAWVLVPLVNAISAL